MSKTDAMRALKQARLAALPAAGRLPTAPAAPVRPAAVRPGAAPVTTADPAPSPVAAPDGLADLVPEALCGHTAIGGRRCTRPHGHPEKNHRYATR